MASLGLLRVVPPAALDRQQQQAAEMNAAAEDAAKAPPTTPELVGFVKGQFEIFRNHRNTQNGWSERLLVALRTFNGQYDSTQLREIKKFGGSQIYARVTAQKCRAASSLLRDVYLGADRPWAVEAPVDPTIPDDIAAKIDQLIQMEIQMLQQHTPGQFSPSQMLQRRQQLLDSAREAAKKVAVTRARDTEEKIETLLREGGFYTALAEFLVDITIFPFACIKGPVVRVLPKVQWQNNQPLVQMVPTLTWNRVSPFDLWWTPGVADIKLANVIEKLLVTRTEINDLLDLPGYDHDALRAALQDYGPGGLYDNWDTTDAERAILESRENPAWNRSAMISMMEFNGNVQGQVLTRYGIDVDDPLRDYHIQSWMIGRHVIKVQKSPSPRQRHPYFITSFEKVPGTPVGNGLTDLISDLQVASNATLRSTINNLSIASGPQVVIYDDLVSPEENTEDLFPWKRWHLRSDPFGNLNRVPNPISFFQPQSNAQELMGVYKQLIEIADDVSAIPKYIGGQASSGGAGRTASGLAMLMGNASKILQSVSANIDRDVFEQALQQFIDIVMLTDESGLLTGEENLTVLGVQVAIQRETQRQRQLEFLGSTANPVDQKIMGIKGRGTVLRSVSQTIGLPGEDIVPTDEKLEQMQEAEQQQQAQGPIPSIVAQAAAKGVGEGVKRITADLTAGGLAQAEQVSPGPPVHLGTPMPQGQAAGPPGPGGPGMPGGAGVGGPPTPALANMARGAQPAAPNQGMGPQLHLMGPGTPQAGGHVSGT